MAKNIYFVFTVTAGIVVSFFVTSVITDLSSASIKEKSVQYSKNLYEKIVPIITNNNPTFDRFGVAKNEINVFPILTDSFPACGNFEPSETTYILQANKYIPEDTITYIAERCQISLTGNWKKFTINVDGNNYVSTDNYTQKTTYVLNDKNKYELEKKE